VGKQAEGVALLEQALARLRKRPGPLAAQFEAMARVLAETYDRSGQFARSEPLYREVVEKDRKTYGPGTPHGARLLTLLALNLLRQRKGAEAEPILRECLAVWEKKAPAGWEAFEAKALLGVALLVQKKYAEAEPLLRAGYEGLKQRAARIPPWYRARLREPLDWLIKLAETQGNKEAAEKWRKEREAMAP